MSTVFVKPAKGSLVRDLQTKTALPEGGAEVSLDGKGGTFWRRRIADGSVVVVEKKKESIPEPEIAADTTESVGRTERGGRHR